MKSTKSIAVTAALVAIFLSLANWQWNRAADLQKPIKLDNHIYTLEEVAAPAEEISDSSIHKLVKVNGKFLLTRKAQFTNPGKIWDVSLMATDSNAAVLVVRGIAGTENKNNDEATVIGRYFPPQGNDVRENSEYFFSRIDSSLVVTDTELPLYAGFILAESEDPTSNYSKAEIKIGSKVPGYYWQHISYVVIWLLFAVVVLYLPRYQRRLDRGE